MLVCERFPQIGGIQEYMALPPGERALYNQYTIYAVQQEAKRQKTQIIRLAGGRKR